MRDHYRVPPYTLPFALALPSGQVAGYSGVNKFGRAKKADSGTDTDIWDRANAAAAQTIWTAPTQARTHQIASTSASDDGDPAGVGAQTLRIYGLTGWGADEVSEVITMNGTTDVPTANQYVIIHRKKVLTWGASGPNVGVITATADADGTVTAQINAGEGQTQMAVYGVPSTKIAYITSYYASAIKANQAVSASIKLLVNPTPDAQLGGFITKNTVGILTDGSTYIAHQFNPYNRIEGPAIIKVQVNASANSTDVSGGFDLILESI